MPEGDHQEHIVLRETATAKQRKGLDGIIGDPNRVAEKLEEERERFKDCDPSPDKKIILGEEKSLRPGEEARLWVESEDGMAAIQGAAERADREIAELREARHLSPEAWRERMTI